MDIRLMKAKRIALRTILYALLTAFAITTLLPFAYMILTSFRSQAEMREYIGVFYLIPKEFTLDSYKKLFAFNPNQFSFIRGVLNTMKVEAALLLVGLIVDVFCAYGFAKVNFKGRDTVLICCLIGPPSIVTLMPTYMMWSKLGLVGTMWPLIIPNLVGNMGITFYLERYMKNLPNEIFEAGTVDGLGHLGKIIYLAFPLIKPALVIQAVFAFLGVWNDLLGPEVYLTSVRDKTIQVMLMSLASAVQSGRASAQPLLMAAATLSSLPIFILYLSCQNLLVNAMAATAIKG